jgi:hypothetical protein
VTPETPTTLRRGWLAPLRTLRTTEWLAWFAILIGVLTVHDRLDVGQDLAPVVFGLAGLAGRLAIATEWVRCDATGVSWRSVFVTRRVPWEQIASMEIGWTRRPFAFPGSIYRRPSFQCIEIVPIDGGLPWQLLPSVWVPVMHQVELISAARLISPIDWSLLDLPDGGQTRSSRVEHATTAARSPGSGKRVGRPVPRRRTRSTDR